MFDIAAEPVHHLAEIPCATLNVLARIPHIPHPHRRCRGIDQLHQPFCVPRTTAPPCVPPDSVAMTAFSRLGVHARRVRRVPDDRVECFQPAVDRIGRRRDTLPGSAARSVPSSLRASGCVTARGMPGPDHPEYS